MQPEMMLENREVFHKFCKRSRWFRNNLQHFVAFGDGKLLKTAETIEQIQNPQLVRRWSRRYKVVSTFFVADQISRGNMAEQKGQLLYMPKDESCQCLEILGKVVHTQECKSRRHQKEVGPIANSTTEEGVA